jgi:hypothetical protein
VLAVLLSRFDFWIHYIAVYCFSLQSLWKCGLNASYVELWAWWYFPKDCNPYESMDWCIALVLIKAYEILFICEQLMVCRSELAMKIGDRASW